MKRSIVEVRVRPQRVAVLISKTGVVADFLLAVRFLSRIWGGRFCEILAVDLQNTSATLERLAESRPDFIYTVSIGDAAFCEAVQRTCQPRGVGPLVPDYVDRLHFGVENHITVGDIIHAVESPRPVAPGVGSALTLFEMPDDSPFVAYVASIFGIPYNRLTQDKVEHTTERLAPAATFANLVRWHTWFVKHLAPSWLDIVGHGLTPLIFGQLEPPPTIVIAGSEICDLALFWNIRMASDCDVPIWVLPVPTSALTDENTYGELRDWLLSFERIRGQSTFCHVVSETVTEELLREFAARLKGRLAGSYITHVDVLPAPRKLPVVVAFEREHQMPGERRGQRLIFHPPGPAIIHEGPTRAWCIDFLKDAGTSRAVGELCLPHRPSSLTVLNAPCPPHADLPRFMRLGVGPDCFNLRCSSTKVTSLCVPTSEEVLSACLREAGLVARRDEKRACYRPVIRMFGGLEAAGDAFSGKCRKILEKLRAGICGIDEIKRSAVVGKGKLTELASPLWHQQFLSLYDNETKKIVRKRLRRLGRIRSPSAATVESLLEFWADRGIAERRWKLGPCPACLGTFWEANLDISKSVRCPGCQIRMSLPSSMPLGYALHRAVDHALREGLAPVVLTARYLRSLSTKGFQWLPGAKFQWGENEGDLDIVANCDGHLIFAECKTMVDASPGSVTWNEITSKFRDTVAAALHCRAELVVLAALCDEFPATVRKEIEAAVPESLGLLLLNRGALESGDGRDVLIEGTALPWRRRTNPVMVAPAAPPDLDLPDARRIRTPLGSTTYSAPETPRATDS